MGKQNITKRMVEIELDKTRHLFYSMSGFIYLSERYGDPMAAFAQAVPEDGKMTSKMLLALRDVIYAGLMHEDDKLTPEQIANMIDFSMLNDISDKVRQALEASTPDPEGDPQ